MAGSMSEKYLMSFTSGALFYRESIKIVDFYLKDPDWETLKARILRDKVLRVPTENSVERISREIISRLKCLSEDELKLLSAGSRQEQLQLLWLGICRKYHFIRDFATDVVREKFYRLNMSLTLDDYNAFFNAKAQWHEELSGLSLATQRKLRQVVFRIMREAEVITRDNKINPGFLTARIVHMLKTSSPSDFAVFPVHDEQIRELAG